MNNLQNLKTRVNYSHKPFENLKTGMQSLVIHQVRSDVPELYKIYKEGIIDYSDLLELYIKWQGKKMNELLNRQEG